MRSEPMAVPILFGWCSRPADAKDRGAVACVSERPNSVRLHQDDGSATVTACLALAALLVLTVLVMHVGGVIATRHRAQAAADLAALAAAAELPEGADAGCATAEELGRRMTAGLIRCEVAGWDVQIEVIEKVPVGPFGSQSIRAIARAGPVEEGG
ncbi:Rv3654c family TadE-like protein [Nocardia carnea]|uniref:Rv3654c family TadE-like protein n=1 Tax=Nocardia carnea TaxID=37328 RepID=UPI0032AF6A27